MASSSSRKPSKKKTIREEDEIFARGDIDIATHRMLDLRTGTNQWAHYSKMISDTRFELPVKPLKNGVIILKDFVEIVSPLFIDFVFRIDTCDQVTCDEVRLRMQVWNLYIVGFKVNGSWFELKPEEGKKHKIKGSEFLPFSCNYHEMKKTELGKVSLGEGTFIRALKTLASHTPKKGKQWSYDDIAYSFLAVCINLAEAIRFDNVLHGVLGECHVLGDLADWVLKWTTYSKFVVAEVPDSILKEHFKLCANPSSNIAVKMLGSAITLESAIKSSRVMFPNYLDV